MKSLIAFTKKELLEQLRTGRLLILGLIFLLLGVMNPGVAKLTPWLFEIMADDLAQSGMVVTQVTVTAMDSWVQFYKNIPIGLIAFLLLESGIFTREYQTGTLVLSLTKGLPRWQVVVSKAAVLATLWTAGYWLCYGVTWGYNAYFWDNAVAQNLTSAAAYWWLFGLWTVALLTFFSALVSANTGALAGTGCVVLASYLLGLFPKLAQYSPTALTGGNALIHGTAQVADCTPAVLVVLLTGAACFAGAVAVFNRKRL